MLEKNLLRLARWLINDSRLPKVLLILKCPLHQYFTDRTETTNFDFIALIDCSVMQEKTSALLCSGGQCVISVIKAKKI